ncbi:MAG TPA: hypothetical protein VGX03_12920 [Candidatus Binatia bacterium]|jgi:hypothetical protein|nr:hypothetical protein [Candidatus Binatia bacterium]
MHGKTFLRRPLWAIFVSFALTLSSHGILMAQVTDLESQGTQQVSPPTPAPPAAAPAQASKVLASEELESGVRVDILELKRTSGETVTLRFAVVNETKEKFDLQPVASDNPGFTFNVAKITLLDAPNKKKYLVMRDSEKNCVCSRGEYGGGRVEGGTRRLFWAKFQAPPANVEKITIEMPGTLPFEDLPIVQ